MKALFLTCSIALVTLLSSVTLSQSLMVTPKRVVLDSRHRFEVVNLFNNSDDTMSYAISWRHFRMTEGGEYMDTLMPDDHIADTLVRFFPPQVTLPPHSAQIVRLRFLKPVNLPPGEYRSHLAMAGIEKGLPVEWTVHDTLSNRVSVYFRPVWGVSIPVIVRTDTTPPIIRLDSLQISTTDSTRRILVSVNLLRSGSLSCYGSFVIKHVDLNGVMREIGQLNGVAVLPPLSKRRVRILGTVPAEVDLNMGTLSVDYLEGSGLVGARVQAGTMVELGDSSGRSTDTQ